MNMSKYGYTCKEIVEAGLLFNVPIYQRLFVWGETEIEKLLTDIEKAAGKQSVGHGDDYYIGVVTVVENNKRFDLVDGQQRNTFLTLFAAECIARNDHIDMWRPFVFHLSANTKCEECVENLRINYSGRFSDQEDIVRMCQGCDEIKNVNFRIFHRCWDRWYKRLVGDVDKLADIISFLYARVRFFVSQLPQYSPHQLNLYFERMNSAGQQLGVLDIVKGRYFPECAAAIDAALSFGSRKRRDSVADGTGIVVNAEDGAHETKQLEAIIVDPNIDPGVEKAVENRDVRLRSVLSSEVMMMHVLAKMNGIKSDQLKIDVKSLVTEFADFFEPHKEDERKKIAVEFVRELEKYRDWIDDNVIYIDTEADDRIYRFRKESEIIGDENSMNSNSSEEHVEELKCAQYQSMLYVSYPISEEWVYDLYCQHCNDVEKIGKGTLLCELKNWDKERLPEYADMDYNHVQRRWFWRLDYILWELFVLVDRGVSKSIKQHIVGDMNIRDGVANLDVNALVQRLSGQDNPDAPQYKNLYRLATDVQYVDAIKAYIFRQNRSIEHLHPQTYTDKGGSVWDSPIEKDVSTTYEDSFGNLAMISSSFNSLQSNAQINEKVSRIKDQVSEKRLESIKMVLMAALTGVVGGNVCSWTTELAAEHGRAMYEILKQWYSGE